MILTIRDKVEAERKKKDEEERRRKKRMGSRYKPKQQHQPSGENTIPVNALEDLLDEIT